MTLAQLQAARPRLNLSLLAREMGREESYLRQALADADDLPF